MEIIVGKESGFCFGVKRAVDGVKADVKNLDKLYCLGEIVHNEGVVNELENLGVKFVEDLDEIEDESNVAIRAHGVDEKTYKIAESKRLKVRDYTCSKVAQIHLKIKEKSNDGYTIILIGKKSHPETIGSMGYADNIYVIETIDEIESLPKLSKVFSIVQTTFSMSKYLEIEKALKEKYSNIECLNTICASTKNRQEECAKIAKETDFMIIVGGKNSSNTKKLYEVACANCENCIIIQDETDKQIEDCKKYDIIGIMSGASTPIETVQKIVEKINSLCEV